MITIAGKILQVWLVSYTQHGHNLSFLLSLVLLYKNNMSPWYYNPQTGGTKIPEQMQDEIRSRILKHAKKLYPKNPAVLNIRFKAQFCYVDAQEPGQRVPTHLCRLRYFSGNKEWSLAFYAYSSEKYEPCFLNSGEWCGTVEEAFKTGSTYLES